MYFSYKPDGRPFGRTALVETMGISLNVISEISLQISDIFMKVKNEQ